MALAIKHNSERIVKHADFLFSDFDDLYDDDDLQ
jgi:hypothetical protein